MEPNGGISNAPRHGQASGPSASEDEKMIRKEEGREAVRIIQEMSALLNTGLDNEELALCLRLCEKGVNPEKLANLVTGWKQKRNSK